MSASIAVTPTPSANAAVTIGSNLSGSTEFAFGCIGCTAFQLAHPTLAIQSPIDGVVVRYRIKKEAVDWGEVRLRILRPVGGGAFGAVGTSSPAPTSAAPDGILEFPAQLRVQTGDHVGIDATGALEGRIVTDAAMGTFSPSLADEAPPASPSSTLGREIFLNADIEPDCDNDGFGDETQDTELPLSEACGKGNRSLTLDVNKNRVKKGKKVRLSGRVSPVARQGPCATGQTVELQRKRPKQTAFTTFAQVQTDAQGGFSLKKKVKKTFEYRAQVVETAACTTALSNSEKVKVRKKRRKR
jgi:hypothetical protein